MQTLGDLIDQTEFDLTLLTGGNAAREHQIAGAHNSETPHPSQFLPPEWLMLTLGLQLPGDTDKQRELIAELDNAGICALGFGVGVAFRKVPQALIDAAAERNFPVFEIPYDTPYREIVGYVNRSLINPDIKILQRSLSMQNYLMDALRDDNPIANLVARLAHLLHGTVLLFNNHGELESSSGDAPVASLWSEVQSSDLTPQRALVADSQVVSVPILADGQPVRRLVLVHRNSALPKQLVMSVLQAAERLLGLIALHRRAALAEERMIKAELLAATLEPMGTYETRELTARARHFGIDFGQPVRVYVFAAHIPGEGDLDRGRAALESLSENSAIPCLTAFREPYLVALVQAEITTIQCWLSELTDRDRISLTGGAGPAIRGIEEVAQSYRGARGAIRMRGAQLRMFEEIDLASWLLGSVNATEVALKLDDTVAALHGHGWLRETTSVYIEHNANVNAAARSLAVHPNTLRYRLEKIEQLLGRSLSDLSTLADLYLVSISGRLS